MAANEIKNRVFAGFVADCADPPSLVQGSGVRAISRSAIGDFQVECTDPLVAGEAFVLISAAEAGVLVGASIVDSTDTTPAQIQITSADTDGAAADPGVVSVLVMRNVPNA